MILAPLINALIDKAVFPLDRFFHGSRGGTKEGAMRKNIAGICIVAAISLLIIACGGGGSGGDDRCLGGDDLSDLEGSWRGIQVNLVSEGADEIVMEINSSGGITSIVQGVVDTGLTGNICRAADRIYGLELSDGTVGGFIVDGTYTHMTVADEDVNVGVLEKNAGARDEFEELDLVGYYSGITAVVDLDWELLDYGGDALDVQGLLGITGVSGQVFGTPYQAQISDFDGTIGAYQGTWLTGTEGMSGYFLALLSYDKSFVGTVLCLEDGLWPDDCYFGALPEKAK